MATEAPRSYQDPFYADLASGVEQKLGLPVGLVSSIITKGERSNADQVSEAGARTVAQITPATRQAALDKYGIDAYLSPENAIDVAGHLLKDSLDRNNGDVTAAVGEYHGGTDRSNWGPRTKAYIGRVTQGQEQAKASTLSNDFAAFMTANPAVPDASQRPQAATSAPAAPDPLSQAFGAWRQQQEAAAANPPPPPPGVVDKLVGAGEAALSLGTGTIAGYPAALASELDDYSKGVANFLGRKLGLPGPDIPIGNIDENATAAGQRFTYQPRTDLGQEYAQAAGDALVPLAGAAPELGMMGAAVRPVATQLRGAIAPAAETLRTAASAAPDAIRSAAGKVGAVLGIADNAPEAPATATPGTMQSAGAAGTDMAVQRTQNAASMPVPIKLTKGQETRTFEQMRFEQETAKDPVAGAPLRERFADQNEKIPQNFERMIDQTGAEAAAPADVGRAVVDNGLVKDAAARKAEYRAKYQAAEKAGEMEAPVSLQGVIDHLNDTAGEETTAPLLTTARKLAVKLGIAEDVDGKLVAPEAAPLKAAAAPRGGLFGEAAQPPAAQAGVTLATAERFRQAINRNTGYEPTNVRQSAILKQLVDQATEGKGGALYRQARQARQRYAQLYENNAVVADLLRTRKGTSDRQVALENVFDRTILNGSREDLGNLRRTLHVSGSEEGRQAWRELQGATVRWLNEESTKNVGTDIRGNPIVSAARLNNAMRALETGGKLEFILGKRGAQQVRDLNDLVKVVYTAPPGSVNTSNTASVLMAALAEAGVTGSMTGLPVPVLSGLRLIANHVKDRRMQIKVQQALNNAPTPPAKPARAPRGSHKPPKNVH